MKCPICGANLGKLKNHLVAIKGKEASAPAYAGETYSFADEIYAQLVEVNEFTVHGDGTTTHDNNYFVCPICGARFRPKKRDAK